MLVLLALTAQGATPADQALAHVGALADTSAPFHVVRSTPFAGGERVRLAQSVDGLPVWGSSMVVVFDPAGGVRRTVGAPVLPPTDLEPTFPVQAAIDRVDGVLPGAGEMWAPYAELGLYAPTLSGESLDAGAEARLVHKVHVSRAEPLAAWAVYVDAHTGVILSMQPSLFTARANVYETNPEQGDPVEIDIGPVGDTLANEYAMALSCVDWDDGAGACRELTTYAEPDASGDYLFPPDDTSSTDPFAEVMMFHHIDLVGRWFEDLGFRHDPLSGQRQMQALANIPYNNAFFGDADADGILEVAFGENFAGDFAYDADVIYHEYTHSVYGALVQPNFGRADAYGTDGAPGGLNEGSADWFAMALTGDPKVGEYGGLLFLLDGPVRNLKPDSTCPNDIYNQTHEDGRIWGSLGWNLIGDPLIGGQVAAEVGLGALAEFPSDVSWKQAGKALVNSADDLLDAGSINAEQHTAIVAHAEASGIVGCERVIRLEDVESSRQMVTVFGLDAGTTMATQFSLDAPAGTTDITFRIDEKIEWQGDIEANVYVRRAEFVKHELVDLGYFQLATPKQFDFEDTGIKKKSYEWRFDAQTDPPLEPGATYYFSVSLSAPGGFGTGEMVVSGESTVIPPEPEPVAAVPGDESPGGCGCSTPAGPAGAWLGLLAVLGLSRRR
ncbi:MAG: MYXO-CTERM domain-containing protein [Myxococcota bacterium]|jgi:MYXO-CTERM domain-containing protein